MTKWYSVLPVIFLLAFLKVSQYDIVKSVEYVYYDFLQRNHDIVNVDDIVLVNIDERAIEKEGQYPWPRQTSRKVYKPSTKQFSTCINNDMVRERPICGGSGTINLTKSESSNPSKRPHTPNYYG